MSSKSRPTWSRTFRREVQYALDLGVLGTAFGAAYALRFDFAIPPLWQERLLPQLLLVVFGQFLLLLFSGIYKFVWRYISLSELSTFVRAIGLGVVVLVALRLGLPDTLEHWRVPLSVILIDAALALGGLLGLRILRRSLYERYERTSQPFSLAATPEAAARRKTLLIGAGRAGIRAARELERQPARELEILGFLDDDVEKHGSIIHGLPVLGPSSRLAQFVTDLGVEVVCITMVQASRGVMRTIAHETRRLGLDVRVMPSLFEILEGRLEVARFRKLRIDDLLGREAVDLDKDQMHRFLLDRRVMVTGAGGSIGSELVRQVARFAPDRLILVERAEPALFLIHREIRALWPEIEVVPLLTDVGDEERLRAAFERERPEILLHAAAHKHVPLVEENPCEAVRNNSLATRRLAELAGEFGVERFVLISTDKAVRPTSVMGASKRVAELLVQDLHRVFPETQFLAVRFGNVLGSTGSVVPIFREQIERGGPVTVTHPDMVRYFMTIPEAAQLVLEAATLGTGGEIFVLDMGEPVKIVSLARDMIRLAGLRPDEDIEIQFTGMRPGEKLFEEIEIGPEQLAKTVHPKIFTGRLSPYPQEEIRRALETLASLCARVDDRGVRAFLSEFLPEAHLDAPASLARTSRDSGPEGADEVRGAIRTEAWRERERT